MAGARNGTPKKELPFPDNLTPRESRIYQLLSDGERHTKPEIHACLEDELSDVSAIRDAIKLLRRKLPPERMIVCECAWMTIYYRMVCPLFPDYISPRDMARHTGK